MVDIDRAPQSQLVVEGRQRLDDIVRSQIQTGDLSLDEIREKRQTVVIRAHAQSMKVPLQIAELISEFSPGFLRIRGIEMSHYPASPRHLEEGPDNEAYRTDISIAVQRLALSVSDDPRKMVILFFDPNESPMKCGILVSRFFINSLTRQIYYEQEGQRSVDPKLIVSVAESLARFQPDSPYDKKTIVAL